MSTTLESVEAHAVDALRRRAHPDQHARLDGGRAAEPLARASWGLPLDERGRVLVDRRCGSRASEHVWSLGDCARVPNLATPGEFDPPTCQHALRQARRLAKNLTGTPQPYRYRMLGQVATLGRHQGIADVFGFRFRGFLGWWITRTYHLYQLPLVHAEAARGRRLDGRRSSSAATSPSSACSAIRERLGDD